MSLATMLAPALAGGGGAAGLAWLNAGSSVLAGALGGNKSPGPSSAVSGASGYLDGSGWVVNTAPGGSASATVFPWWMVAAGALVVLIALKGTR